MSDVEVASEWSMYAFDMPGHGRSSMPTCWAEGAAYSLSLDEYLETCSAFIEQVVGGPAVIMGCSMGAAMSLVLAARRPDLVLGVIALEAPWRAPGRKSPLLADARINASLHNPAYVRGLMGPNSPRQFREQACWIYSQAGFGVYAGDLGFYSEQFDGELIGTELKGTPIPIVLLTGEFDYSASPDNTRILAQLIETADFREMRGLGHFPMIEHPLFFRGYWVHSLDRIKTHLADVRN
jgi:pimeloyl-ACP methyl ester carboxylesterase